MKISEFFQGGNGKLSMSRLMYFMAFFPASFVVIATKGENALGWYLGSYAAGYVGGKGTSALMAKAPPVTP